MLDINAFTTASLESELITTACQNRCRIIGNSNIQLQNRTFPLFEKPIKIMKSNRFFSRSLEKFCEVSGPMSI